MKFMALIAAAAAIKIKTELATELDALANSEDTTELDNQENEPDFFDILSHDATPSPEVCAASLQRLYAGNNNDDYEAYEGQNNGLYEDETFPAGPYSLMWPGMNKYYLHPETNWARPPQMHERAGQGTEPLLFPEGELVGPDSIQQGSLGDCWFLAAVAALAEHPDRARALFTNTEYSNEGIFQTKWHVGGEEVRVTIDDRLPYSQNRNEPEFARDAHGAYWVPLLEKAVAKLYVNYSNIVGGNAGLAFSVLTDQPIGFFKWRKKTPGEIWDAITEFDRKGYVMSSGSLESGVTENGLAYPHAYSLIGTIEVTDANGDKHRLVKARNPWKSEGYSGPWSDDSDLWTDDLRQQAGAVDEQDGIFFFPIEDITTNFYNIAYVAYRDDGWKRSTQKLEMQPGQQANLSLTVASPKEFWITCYGISSRLYPRNCASSDYQFYNDAKYNIMGESGRVGKGKCERGDKSLAITLPVGTYQIEFEHRDTENSANYTLRTFAEETNEIALL